MFFGGYIFRSNETDNYFISYSGTDDYDKTIEFLKTNLADMEENKAELETTKGEYETYKENHIYSNSDYTELEKKYNELINENASLRAYIVGIGEDPNNIPKPSQTTNSGIALTELTDAERNRDSRIETGSDAASKDNTGKNYSYGISSWSSRENSIEYWLGGEYKTLKGTLIITLHGASNYSVDRWDKMSFTIYGDGREIWPGDLYAPPSYNQKMEPISIDVSIENINYLKIVFNNASYDDKPLICFATPQVYN